MGQALLDPPTVKGYAGGRKWINPVTWLARRTFLLESAAAARLAGALPPELARAGADPGTACEALLGARLDDAALDAVRQAIAGAEGVGADALDVVICHPLFQRC